MNKIININLGGRNIAIEETAHEKIKAYTESLRRHFMNEEGRDEIVSDIENRFSELMYEKTRKGATYITDADVEEMIGTMGRPEDFDAAGENETATGGAGFSAREKRRLYRDQNNKVLGGVCGGLANWLNVDPTVVRVLFAIVSFGGFGSGILIYILLWIFLPARDLEGYPGKKMFRNPDDKMIGGVAGGLAAYFNIKSSVIRFIFAAPLILSILNGALFHNWDNDFDIFPGVFFGGLTGTFIFIYIVLWIVLPEALGPYEKMEMHGKTIDVNTIRQNVQGSMGDIKDRLKIWGSEVKDSAGRLSQTAGQFANTRGREFGREFSYAARRGGRGIGYAIAMIFKAIAIFIAGSIAIALFVAFLALLFSGFAWAPFNNFLWTSDSQQILGLGTLLFFIGAPIVGILIWLTRRILNITTPGNYLNWLFGGLWTIGWVCMVFFLASISKDFKRYQSVEEPVAIQQPAGGKLILKVSQPELMYAGNFGWINDNDIDGFNITKDTLSVSSVAIDFQKSPDSLYHVTIKREGLGSSDAEAMGRIKKISYKVAQADSVLDLQNGFSIDKNSKYRFQNVVVIVDVPVGKKINIDESVFDKLNDMNVDFNNRKRYGRNARFIVKSIRHYRSNTDYTMDSTGNLVSADATINATDENDENYRWEGDTVIPAPAVPVAPVPPAAPAAPAYRYNTTPTPNKSKEELARELEQKQKEVEALKKKLDR